MQTFLVGIQYGGQCSIVESGYEKYVYQISDDPANFSSLIKVVMRHILKKRRINNKNIMIKSDNASA